ncbi:MAG: GTPase domain-containing protein [Planctomycetaceae bacterium]
MLTDQPAAEASGSLFGACATEVKGLLLALSKLEAESHQAQVGRLEGREWYELLGRKLLPQLTDDAYLVVAVVGGTNIGKSVIFNHIAGCRASATSPLASGTKHPTLLVRGEFVDSHDLAEVFPGFELTPWVDADGALAASEGDKLFWRVSAATPPNLLVLDTPDIDSDARINWDRADNIRRCADVLIAVLTQQKYNDAAVKEFFRKAAQEDKAVIIVFNQCQLPDDEAYWPLWVKTFCDETGVNPECVYVAPNNRQAAESNQLPFYERCWPIELAGDATASASPVAASPTPGMSSADTQRSSNLLDDLSRLKFADVKLRTLRGSIREVLDVDRGLPAYLKEIETRSEEYRSAADLLSAHQLAEIDNWPTIPNNLMVAEIRRWWADQREGWSAKVHGFYNIVGRGITWPFRAASEAIRGEAAPPLDRYRDQEWNAILDAIEKVMRRLTWLAELGNDLLKPRLHRVLQGTNRGELLERIQAEHRSIDLEQQLRDLVDAELVSFRSESPRHFELFRKLDSVAAAVRPATSVVLFLTGVGPVGHAITPALTDTALQSVLHVAGDVAGGTMAAAVGDTMISSGASASVGFLEAKFRQLHAAFTAQRAAWLASLLKEQVLGTLPEEVLSAALIPEQSTFQQVRQIMQNLDRLSQ